MASSETDSPPQPRFVDFSDTQIAFAHKSDRELRQTSWLFKFMNQPLFVKAGSAIGLWLNDTGINIFNPLIRITFFKQFCGGTSLEDCKDAIDHLRENNTLAVLDYGAEGKTTEEDFDKTLSENIKAIQFASGNPGVPVISSKVTALASNELLEKYQSGHPLSASEIIAFEKVIHRLDKMCAAANNGKVALFIDAEETWIQDTIDELVKKMMEKYNRESAIVYHTYQMYRKDKLEDLKNDHVEAKAKGYILGAKVVRGAYMEKERKRAEEKGYPSPIHDTKEDTDKDFNAAIKYCVDHYLEIASCNASHNLLSNKLQAELITGRGLPKRHSHLSFCQLYGMSDNITFNLAASGYNVAKYVPYGPVKEVIPYLIRRARENSAVTGEMSRELSLIMQEMRRRKMK